MLTREIRFFILMVAMYCIAMTVWIYFVPKGAESIACYHSHNPATVNLFIWITQLGEWLPIIGLAIYLLIKNRRAYFAALISFLPLYLVVLYLKKALNYPRPHAYFTHGEIAPISDYIILLRNSMPSGHTFSAFVVASFICTFYSINRWVQVGVFGLACAVGFSRIYLLCHFKEDVFVGSIIGITAGVLPLFIYSKWLEK
jgi:membrane-associated phospholipid phosphatase